MLFGTGKMRHNQFIITAIFSVMLLSSRVSAQDVSDEDLPEALPRPNVFSPQVTDIMKYDSKGTNIYRGSVDFGGGKLMADSSGTFRPLYHVTDRLGSVRVICDGAGNVLEKNDYYPSGLKWETSTPQFTDNRLKFNGKEDQLLVSGTTDGNAALLHYGARLYSPAISRWFSPDPLSENYYGISPYAFCANNPVNIIDPDGLAWYYNSKSGDFVAQYDDGNDNIYLLTPEQINKANGDKGKLDSYQDLSNSFGQILLENNYDPKVASSVLLDLFERATWKDQEGTEKYMEYRLNGIEFNNVPANLVTDPAKINRASKILTITPSSGYFYKGYDVISLFSHEFGHVMDNVNGIFHESKYQAFERFADEFAFKHWSWNKSSDKNREKIFKNGSR